MSGPKKKVRDSFIEDLSSEHYWICYDCAKSKGWEPVNWAVSVIKRPCPTCGTDTLLACSFTDFIKSGRSPIVRD